MKTILMAVVALVAVFTVIFAHFSPQATVTTPEIKRTGNYERPVRDGNCYLQTDSTGNQLKVCG